MAVGAYAAYNIAIWLPWLNIIVVLCSAGLVAAAVGILFGLPSACASRASISRSRRWRRSSS